MKAVRFHHHGGPEVLRYEDVAEPGPPAAGEVLLRVHAVSVNRTLNIEVCQRGAGWGIPLPHVPGVDPAGEILATGEAVEGWQPGDRVAVSPMMACGTCSWCLEGRPQACDRLQLFGVHIDGGYAEVVRVPAANLLRIPSTLSYEQASAMTLTYPVAWHLLRYVAAVKPGETVLIMAAGSGIGTAGIVLARQLGARVIAAAGADWKLEKARELGADEVINYATQDLVAEVRRLTAGRGVEVVFENISSPELWPKSIGSLAKFGRLVTCGTHGGGFVEVDMRYLYRNHLRILGAQSCTRAMEEEAFRLVAEGRVPPPVIDRTFPLAEAQQAWEHVLSRDLFGRVVLLA